MRILLIDDDAGSRKALSKFLTTNLGHDVSSEASCDEALTRLADQRYPLIITDIKMAGTDGLSFLKQVKNSANGAESKVVLITGHGCLEDAIEALRLGAHDYLLKPLDIRQLAKLIQNMQETLPENQKIEQKKYLVPNDHKTVLANILEIPDLGKAGFFSDEMQKIRDFALKLNSHREIPVMIEGDTGTGKEIIARLIHHGRDEASLPFVSLNCAAISATLFESELFGYAKGAFTGADPKGKAGKLELAQGGTLLLDEIADMPLEIQPKLLRVLQEREFYRVAGTKKIKLNLRIIASTNRDLSAMVANKEFRSDLYFRLNTAKIMLPPLRKRKKDIIGLANMFLKEIRGKEQKFSRITELAKETLMSYHWQGNVRELRAVIERAYLRYNDIILRAAYLEETLEQNTGKFENNFLLELPEDELALVEIEKQIARKILLIKNNNLSQTARYLKISRNRLKRLLEMI